MSTDLFDPTYCAILRSELQLGDEAFEVVLDTGCSFAMTHDLKDFVSPPVFDDWGTLQTASTTLPLTSFGTNHWEVQTTTGSSFVLTVPGFYVPGSFGTITITTGLYLTSSYAQRGISMVEIRKNFGYDYKTTVVLLEAPSSLVVSFPLWWLRLYPLVAVAITLPMSRTHCPPHCPRK
jgi:hypothetical protein